MTVEEYGAFIRSTGYETLTSHYQAVARLRPAGGASWLIATILIYNVVPVENIVFHTEFLIFLLKFYNLFPKYSNFICFFHFFHFLVSIKG